MLLSDLHAQLAPSFPAYARKDLQTAVRVLAQALQCPDPEHCPLEQYRHPLPTLYRKIEDYLSAKDKGSHTIRNTKNNLSRLFRKAAEQHLFSLAPVTLTPAYDPRQMPSRPGALHNQSHATYLIYAEWPPDLQDAFTAFQTWATAPLIQGRPAHLRKRLTTVEDYKKQFQGYFGYLHHIVHRVPVFDDLFDLDLVKAYVLWHVNDCHHKVTITIRGFLTSLLAITRQYRPLPEVRAELQTLRKTLPMPPPTYNKADAWVPLERLREIGRSLWPRTKPFTRNRTVMHPGLYFARRATVSLMLQLWAYRPYRQRNIREMQLDENLYQDPQGSWRIRFRGEQLKVATKRGQPNVFDLSFPLPLVPVLEAYLATWRPILLAKASHPDTHVFLNTLGKPYDQRDLTLVTQKAVYRYTGKHWHPHIIRTVFATEMILKGCDFLSVAKMLNDRVETVIANYAHLLDNDAAEKTDGLLDRLIGQGK